MLGPRKGYRHIGGKFNPQPHVQTCIFFSNCEIYCVSNNILYISLRIRVTKGGSPWAENFRIGYIQFRSLNLNIHCGHLISARSALFISFWVSLLYSDQCKFFHWLRTKITKFLGFWLAVQGWEGRRPIPVLPPTRKWLYKLVFAACAYPSRLRPTSVFSSG